MACGDTVLTYSEPQSEVEPAQTEPYSTAEEGPDEKGIVRPGNGNGNGAGTADTVTPDGGTPR